MKNFPKMTKRKIIWLSIAAALLLGVLITLGVFLSNMFSFQKQLHESLDVERLYITCDSKYYKTKKEADDEEFELSPVDMYYAKNKNGYYDFSCGDLSVHDNTLYHAAIGPFLGSGSQAELTTKETEEEYQAYFENATKSIGDPFSTPIYNYAAVGKALREHETLFTIKSKKGDETEYKLFFGKGFYEDVIKHVYGGTLVDFNGPMKFPVVAKFKNNKLSQISIKFNATIEVPISPFNPNKREEKNFYEYILYYDYEKEFSVTDEQKEYPYAFYQNYEPKEALQFSSLSYRDVKFYNGKVYVIMDDYHENDHRDTLDIYDLKTGELIQKVDLPQNAYNVFDIVIRGDCMYVRVDPNDENKVFCYNEKTGQSTLYDVPAQQVFFVDGELVVVENGKKISCGTDFNCLAETDKYDGCGCFYYDQYSGNTYAQREIDGKTYLVKLTKDGFSENKIELQTSSFNYRFTQEGIVVRQIFAVDQYGQYTKSKFIQYNYELEKVKEWETEFFDGNYLGETESYVFYTSFVIEKSTGRYYGFDKIDVYERYAIFDGVLYCCESGSMYSTETLMVKDNY